MSCPCG
ncbi:hypothetical protein YPPY66_0495, partial [Yersinia pestis PY-66]